MKSRLAPALALACSFLGPPGVAGPVAVAAREPTLGWLLEPSGISELPQVAAGVSAPIVMVRADWEKVEQQAGVYDWSAVGVAVDSLRGAGYRIGLCLTGTHALYLPAGKTPSPTIAGSLEAWLAFLRGAVSRFSDRVTIYQVGETAGTDGDAGEYAFLLKQSALALRAQAQAADAEVLVAQAATPSLALDWQREIWARDVAAYIDVLPISIEAGGEMEASLAAFRALSAESLAHPPAPALWVYAEPGPQAAPWDLESVAVAALAEGAAVGIVVDAPGPDGRGFERGRWMVGLQQALAEGYAPAPVGSMVLSSAEGGVLPGARVLARFFSDRDFSALVVYRAPVPAGIESLVHLSVDGSLRAARLLDLIGGQHLDLAIPAGTRALAVPGGEAPRALILQQPVSTPGFEIPTEDLEITSSRRLTAEEIIARHQQVQREQDDRLERWVARGRVDLHFKLVQGGSTVDVSIDSNYFWERDGQLEWEQTDYYINGNKVTWKNIPELPLIQPEKVITLPLDLTLDRTYGYRLVAEERVDGREAYVLEFQPAAPDAPLSLYRGRVWIDRQTFVRLKASVVQTNLEAPVLSNEEIDHYEPRPGDGDRSYWMLSAIDGQQTWSAAGRTFVVRRELTFREFQINPSREQFDEGRRQAYASRNQMLRDTERGFRYLERQPDGSRVVKESVDSSQLLAGGGAFRDSSTGGVTPLAGVNYFNYDLFGKKIQMNAFFAGVLGFFTASKPDLFGRKIDATVDAGLALIKFEDKVFDGDEESLEQRIETRSQNLSLRLGVPTGEFFKFNLVGGLVVRQYFDNDDARRAIDELNMQPGLEGLQFVPPQDHAQLGVTLEAEFNRRGYSLRAEGRVAHRSDWGPWGLFDESSGQFGSLDPTGTTFVPGAPEPIQDSFRRWGLTAFKEWYLPRFQKLRGEVDYLDGADLDRFSRYQFSFFGEDRLNGFSGSGVRFDQGLIFRAGYSFNLFEVIRLDATVDTAQVKNRPAGDTRESFTGVGLSANVVGPWKTMISASYGRALASDIPDLEGEQEFLLLVLKLF